MKRGYRYRIYPDSEQCSLLEQYFGGVRFIYNRSLFIQNLMYSKFKQWASNLKPEYFGLFLLCSLVVIWLHFRRRT
ncbi:helix-turn-helix domain-containing protein [uncultured Methanomethylovorans sp.]|uniref:helix-turn-helix domain-containing protein n=1 Tax=uncultured Methanomethylovorans sp. TaxID=183759 RepID=UPI002AA6D347|nr:helix-turn-helix domain-containing protein [uncultured Methanomethylovorans sp.]